ncbi:MAG TPA: hypothetical protein VGD40_17795 [Chryseosolibacter sp.]
MKTRLLAMAMASLVLFYTGCSEKEDPQPVEDTQRTDALRAELRQLQILIHGAEVAKNLSEVSNDSLETVLESLKAEYNSIVSYQVVAVDFQGNVIPNATITINENGTVNTKTTTDGTATFTGVKSGFITGVVAAAGYSTANFTTTLYSASEGRANTRVPLLPKSAEALAKNGALTIKGFLYANLNVANDTVGGYHQLYNSNTGWSAWTAITSYAGTSETDEDQPWFAPHRSYDKVQHKLYATPMIEYYNVPGSAGYFDEIRPGVVLTVAYEDANYEATFDANKEYTLTVPIQGLESDGVSIDFIMNAHEFTAEQTLVQVGDTFTDGAPRSVDAPKPITYTRQAIYRFKHPVGMWYDYNFENDYSIPTVETGWNLYYAEGSID